jgi:hypothetical protein
MQYLAAIAVILLGIGDARAEATFEDLRGYSIEGVIVPGNHTRLDTVHGAVHVWAPEGYDAATATLVVYIHGYYVDVDDAWWAHGLPEQFGATGINALFVVPESPTWGGDDVRWESITDLALTIEDQIEEAMPKGRKVVVAHSGGFRTVLQWLQPDLDTVVLLDAGYGEKQPYGEWMRKAASHRLITISSATYWWSRGLAKQFVPGMTQIEGFAKLDNPRLVAMLSRERAVHVETSLDHWQVVTTALPKALAMLRATPLPAPQL